MPPQEELTKRLKHLVQVRENIHEALLGIHWEERYRLWDLEEKVKLEIKRTVCDLRSSATTSIPN